MKRILYSLLIILSLSACHSPKKQSNWDELFAKYEAQGTFVVKELKSGRVHYHNPKRAQERYKPASTFKILNSMIALQTSAIKSIDDSIKWDGTHRIFKAWNKDQSIRTAFPISCVWFYQELAKKIGLEQMQKWISAAHYGNETIGRQIDKFWLTGPLEISAQEQVEFIEQLINDQLPFDKAIQQTLKKIMITDSNKEYVMHSKTGWIQDIAWYVGYLENQDNTWAFALNIDMPNLDKIDTRTKLSYEILKQLMKNEK